MVITLRILHDGATTLDEAYQSSRLAERLHLFNSEHSS